MEQIIFNFDVIKYAPYTHIPTNETLLIKDTYIVRVRNLMSPIHPFVPKGDETVEVLTLAAPSISEGKKTYRVNENIIKNVLIKDLQPILVQIPMP